MKNKILSVLAAALLCLTIIIPASATSAPREMHILDEDYIFTDSEWRELEDLAQRISDDYDCFIMLSITEDIDPYSDTYTYTAGKFNENADGSQGIALSHNTGDKKYAFYISEELKNFFPDAVQTQLWTAYAEPETYFDGVEDYLYAVAAVLEDTAEFIDAQATATTSGNEDTGFVPVERTLPLVVDNADVLTDSEEAALITKLEDLGALYEMEVGVVTVDSYEGKTPTAFADDFYDYNGFGYGENDDGFIVVFNTGKGDGNRNLAISTHGTAIRALSDVDIDVIIEMMITPIKNGDYVAAFDTFVDEATIAADMSMSPVMIPVAIVIGFGIAFIFMKIQASKLKSVKAKVDAASYVSDVQIAERYDNFLYRNVSKTPIKKESSTHTSSSGRSHGGGNKSF